MEAVAISPEPVLQVLLVEDDVRLARLTAEYLRGHGMVVTTAEEGRAGLEAALSTRFDVLLLDLMLPGIDGLELCKGVRARSDVPVIFLTARTEEGDRVLGLELGADDYMVKPFSPRELVARVRALVRRARGRVGPASQKLTVGDLTIDPAAHAATVAGRALRLTGYEFTLLRVLAERADRVLSREQLMELARGNAEEAFDRSIDVHICHLRAKLGDDPRQPRRLKTVRGVGYLFSSGEAPV